MKGKQEMGLIDYKDEKLYYIKNLKTKAYSKGFKYGIPVWVASIEEATAFKEMEALYIQRILNTQSLHQRIVLIALEQKNK